jgi:hypothetical protein
VFRLADPLILTFSHPPSRGFGGTGREKEKYFLSLPVRRSPSEDEGGWERIKVRAV